MYEILSGDPRALKIYPVFDYREEEYRLMKYCVFDEIGDETIILNLLNRKMVSITTKENTDETKKYLINNGFLVPVNFDEYEFYLSFKKIFKRVLKGNNIHNFTIFTTTVCNAKCYYCFEDKNYNSTMTLETANQVAEFISDNARGDVAYIRWFGGEPLLNIKVIDAVSEHLKELNVDFRSSIITNATLFDEAMIEKAATKWNVDMVQVTMDGTKEVHDGIKMITSDAIVSAFEATVKNVHRLLDKEIDVQIRLNLSERNHNNLLNLVEYINKEFVNKQHLSVCCKALFEKQNGNDCIRNDNDERTLRTTQYKINERMFELGLYKKVLPQQFKTSNCAAAIGDVITVLPNGDIGLCEHNLNESIGSVYDGIVNKATINRYREEMHTIAECKECPVFPICNRPKVCDAASMYCSKEKKMVMIQEIKMEMRNVRTKNEIKI